MGSDCDDVGALALLNEYANSGKAEVIGVIFSSGAVPYGVGVIDAGINVMTGGSPPIPLPIKGLFYKGAMSRKVLQFI